jgi:hypothetical protein
MGAASLRQYRRCVRPASRWHANQGDDHVGLFAVMKCRAMAQKTGNSRQNCIFFGLDVGKALQEISFFPI